MSVMRRRLGDGAATPRRPAARSSRPRAAAFVAAAALAVGAWSAPAAPATTAAAAGAAAGRAPKPRIVTVADFYFAPTSVTIRKGGAVTWVWSPNNVEPHDVHLTRGPRGLRNRRSYSTSTTAVSEARFRRVFKTPGTYRYICTIHPTQMRMTVKVKR